MLKDDFKTIQSSPSDWRKFGILIGVIVVILGFFRWLPGQENSLWLLIFGLVLIFLGFFLPYFLKPFYKPWMMLAIILGWVMTRVILVITFFLIFLPLHLTAKISGKKFLNFDFKNGKESYWIYRDAEGPEREKLENQF